MKKKLLFTVGLLFLFNFCLNAANLYWVGGTGAWNDPSHWSLVSGGTGGAGIPAVADDVFFDQHSFSADRQTVMLTADGVCHNIDWSSINKHAVFSSAPSRKLTVYGFYTLSSLMADGFKGQTIFAATSTNNHITTAGATLIGNWVFNGTGSWLLADDVYAPAANISLQRGTFNTNDKKITCNNFIGSASQNRTLNLTTSEIYINNTWDCSSPANLTLAAASSRIIFKDTLDTNHFKSGGLSYGSVASVAAACSPSGTACANFTISLTGTNVICNGDANGTAHAVVTGGSGTFSYTWSPTPGAGQGTANVTGLGAGTYTVKVTDQASLLFCFCSIQITEPGVLFDFEIVTTKPLCNGQCNGSSVVDATGGTPAASGYLYSWTGSAGTNDTALNLCAGSYVVTVTDSRGCTGNTTIVVAQPAVLVAPGTATMVTCNGACNGTATVTVSGGTTPYLYNWNAAATPIGDGTPAITSLCPGNYVCVVTDANNCATSFDTVITQPPVLTLAVSHTNASCGGIHDGTATATVTGGVTPYTYVWSTGASLTTPATSNTITGLAAGTYTIQLTDGNGCSKVDSVVITEPAVLLASATGVNPSCFGSCNGTATAVVTGGTPGYSYSWAPGAHPATASISGLCPGTYTVTVTDTHSCTDTGIVVITQPALLVANPTSTNVLCFGDCNGTATAAPVGGTIPYLYDWNGAATPAGDGTPNITGLCAGVYSVKVTDAHGCDTIQSVTVTQPPILTVVMSKTNVTCNAACDGTATATPSGGTPGYSYSWSNGGSTPTITGLCPGTYTVTVTDANSCTKTGTVTITQPNALSVTINSTTLACNGDCNATAAATVTGGTASFSFSWLPASVNGHLTNTVNSLCAGSYTVNVTDLNGCPATANVTINQPTPLTIVSSSTDVSCFGLCNGTASVIAGGGTPGYQYSWAPGGQITPSITGQCAGTYTVTVKDANGCTLVNTVTINTPTQVLGNPSVVNNVTCSGLCNGSATSSATGGTGTYSYNWNPGTPTGDGTPTITNLCAGVYTLITTDANTCSSTQTVTITQPSILSAPITGSTSSCNICNGTATVTPAGGTAGYSYSWSPTASQTTPVATGLCPNVTYTVTVTDAHSCTAASTVTIMQTITITITTSNTTLSCSGSCDGIATANAGGGLAPYSYLWVDSAGTVSTSQTATGLCAGSYTVTVVDANGCLNTAVVVFTNPPLLNVTATHTNATCGGSCNGTASATATGGSGGYIYSWAPGGQTTAAVSGLCAGTYTLTTKDASGCTVTTMVTITEPTTVVDNVTIVDANCLLPDGSITVAPTGGSGTYTYVWSGPGALTGQGTPSLTNLVPGAYTLVITDGSGCPFTFNYLLNNVNGPLLSMVHTSVTCHNTCNGTATVTATGGAGGYIYNWTPGNPAGDGSNAVTALCGTITYTINVTDAAGCIRLDTATVINPSFISPHPTIVNESCGGSCNGSITLNPTGGTPGYSYLWSPGGATTPGVTGLCAGAYTVTVTDANGCDSTLILNVTSPPMLVVTLTSTSVKCAGDCNGTATATPSGGSGAGYTYSWTNQPPAIVLPNIVNLCPNQYIVTLTDGNGCTAKDTVNITEPTPLSSFTTQTNATCNGVCNGVAIVTANGGTLPYAYSWSPGAISNDTASSLCAGSYSPVVTDFNGCTSAPPAVVITQPAAIVPSVTVTNATCNNACNGTATAAPTGGTAPYAYSWSPGTIAGQGTPTATSLCAGAYVLTITDSLGCSHNQNINLIDPPILSANTTSTSPTCTNSCNGSVTAAPVGGTAGYTYSWSPGGAVTPTVSSLCPGVYTVIVTDTHSCKDTQTVSVINPARLDVVVGSTPANCGVCNGSITISPITGVTPYTYLWSPAVTGQGTPNGTSICAGLYNVLVTDGNGCDSSFTIPMNNSGGVTGETVSTIDVSCFGVCNGAGSVVPIGGTAPFTYLWNDGPPPTANDTAINLCANNYFVQVTDSNTCIHFSPVTINQPAPIASNATIVNAVCSNVCTGSISLAPSGGTAGYTYVWSPGGATTSSITGLCPGTYTVVITDAHSCTKTDSFTITESAPLAATISSTNITCSTACNGVAYVTITSGTAPYSIQWNDAAGQTNDTATALCAGNYSVSIRDANGCITTLTTTITATPPVTANPAITNATCGLCDGTAVLAPSGGTAPYNYLWSNGQTTSNASNLCSGLYTVNITDANGCDNSYAIPVSNTSGPTSLAITQTNITCNGSCNGAVTAVTPTGGTPPYTYLWIQGGQTTPAISGLCAGVYYVEVTDSSGCSLLDSVTITQPALILANAVISGATCGVCDGSITIAPSGGIAPYTILWNTGSNALTLTNLCAGIYSVQITDANGCVVNIVIPLSNHNAPSLALTSTNIGCNAACNGTATVVASGGTAPYAYSWNDVGAQTTPIATGLCAGNYAVEVTGANGCVAVGTVSLTQPTPISFSLANAHNPLCNGDTSGVITVIPSGGTLSYTYAWSPGSATGFTASGLGANTYTVTVTDANGCAATQSTTLSQTSALSLSSVFTNPSCNTIADGSIDVTVSGGTSTYVYQWSGGSTATTQDLSGILAGSYTINVTDGNGCTIADTSILTPSQSVFAAAGNDTAFCQNGSIVLNAAASVNGVNYQWFEMPANTSVGSTISVTVNPPTGVTDYYVTVNNGSGCADNDTIAVTSNALPNANAGADVSIVIGQSTPIGGSPTTSVTGASIVWTPLPGLDNATAANPTAAPASTTHYTVTVTSPQGCIASDSMIVTVLPTIKIPDGISPNSDGDNDEWIIDGIEQFPNCTVEVYNRWGELLFQSPGYKEHWKGTYKGKDLPVGTYYYIIDLKDPLFPDAYTGPITILR